MKGLTKCSGIFDQVEENARCHAVADACHPLRRRRWRKAALTYRFGEEHQPVTESLILAPAPLAG